MSRQSELINRIGQALQAALPDGARSITALGEAADDYAKVAFTFIDAQESVRHSEINTNPNEAADEISAVLMELHAVMATFDQAGRWMTYRFTVSSSGDIEISLAHHR